MLLALDIGNTDISCGLYDASDLVQTFRLETARARTADEYGVLLRQMLALKGYDPGVVSAAILASVVPPLTDVVVEAIRQAFAREPMVVGPGVKTGISVLYENPHDVGADRIVNAVAAFERFQSAAVVVDFGTATIFDCVSARAEYLGGVIAPGMKVSLDALLTRAAKLRPIEIAEPPRVVGRNTPHALQSGVVYGYASLVDGLVERIIGELGGPCRVIATGAEAPLVAPHSRAIESVDPHLTLTGLRILHDRNAVQPRQRTPKAR